MISRVGREGTDRQTIYGLGGGRGGCLESLGGRGGRGEGGRAS